MTKLTNEVVQLFDIALWNRSVNRFWRVAERKRLQLTVEFVSRHGNCTGSNMCGDRSGSGGIDVNRHNAEQCRGMSISKTATRNQVFEWIMTVISWKRPALHRSNWPARLWLNRYWSVYGRIRWLQRSGSSGHTAVENCANNSFTVKCYEWQVVVVTWPWSWLTNVVMAAEIFCLLSCMAAKSHLRCAGRIRSHYATIWW